MGKAERKLQDQVSLLEGENEQLRRKLMLVTGGGSQSGSMALGNLTSFGQTRMPQQTIAGLTVAYLIVDAQWRVIRVNSRMSDVMNISKEAVVSKPPLSELDELEWAPGICRTLLQDATDSGQEEMFEAERPNVVTGRNDYFQFKAVWSENQGTVTVEDVTRLRTTRQFFERLVSPRIVERILDTTEDPFLSHKRTMSVLFADLRSFTTFCENVDAASVQTVFNEFFDACMGALERNDATLDKFVGDQVMALIGAPLPHEGHAYGAVKVAVDLQKSIQRLRDRWMATALLPADLVEAHPNILKLGIGINSGEMLLGMFGSEKANQYTVLGHHVNLAARLCSYAAGGEVLASLGTVQEISSYAKTNPGAIQMPIKFRTKAKIEVEGIAEPVTVATLAYGAV
ncbi:MAG: adenylate/guanylate cyclase domain-containing protein [Planctomycetes bacterium]|nr:adenylate/guanylate cyclase domain-containing protein [Planctomycetota bacterium]